MQRFLSLLTALALTASCAELADILVPPDEQPLLSYKQRGIHLHPSGALPEDVPAIMAVASMIRMQVPKDTESFVERLVKNSPLNARFLLILTSSTDLTLVDKFRDDSRVIGWELENEVDNCAAGFLCWSLGEYLDWLRVISPEIRRRSPGKLLVSAATLPPTYEGKLRLNEEFVKRGGLDLVDVFGLHVYGDSWERVPAVAELVDDVWKKGKQVWVTEFGRPKRNEHLDYFRQTPAVWARLGVKVDLWTWYAWREENGYGLVGGADGDSQLLAELRATSRAP